MAGTPEKEAGWETWWDATLSPCGPEGTQPQSGQDQGVREATKSPQEEVGAFSEGEVRERAVEGRQW